GGQLPGDAVVEPRAHGDEDVARVHGEVRPLRPVHAGPAEVQLVRLRERALSHQGRDHGKPADLGQLAELVAGVAVQGAAADVEHRLLRMRDDPGRLADLQGVHFGGWAPAGQVDAVRIAEV